MIITKSDGDTFVLDSSMRNLSAYCDIHGSLDDTIIESDEFKAYVFRTIANRDKIDLALRFDAEKPGLYIISTTHILLTAIDIEEANGYLLEYNELNRDDVDKVKVLFDKLRIRCTDIRNRIKAAGIDTKPITSIKVSRY